MTLQPLTLDGLTRLIESNTDQVNDKALLRKVAPLFTKGIIKSDTFHSMTKTKESLENLIAQKYVLTTKANKLSQIKSVLNLCVQCGVE